MDLVKRKSKGKTVVAKETEPRREGEKKVVDLMEALRKRVTRKKTEEREPAKKSRKQRKAG